MAKGDDDSNKMSEASSVAEKPVVDPCQLYAMTQYSCNQRGNQIECREIERFFRR
jgi:hypothetical protein